MLFTCLVTALYVPNQRSDVSFRFSCVSMRADFEHKCSRFGSNHSSFVFDKSLRQGRSGHRGQRRPQVALHPSVSMTVDVFRFRRTCWQLNWETKCSILLARNGGSLLNVSWSDPKHARKENKASVLCEHSGTLVLVSAACTCLQGCVWRCLLGPSTPRKEPTNKRACCWGRTCRTLKMTDVVAPVARLGYVKCPSVGAQKPFSFDCNLKERKTFSGNALWRFPWNKIVSSHRTIEMAQQQ